MPQSSVVSGPPHASFIMHFAEDLVIFNTVSQGQVNWLVNASRLEGRVAELGIPETGQWKFASMQNSNPK